MPEHLRRCLIVGIVVVLLASACSGDGDPDARATSPAMLPHLLLAARATGPATLPHLLLAARATGPAMLPHLLP